MFIGCFFPLGGGGEIVIRARIDTLRSNIMYKNDMFNLGKQKNITFDWIFFLYTIHVVQHKTFLI